MSGHSKWSTIKHQKAVNDIKKGKIFSKLVRGITLAIKSGGGSDPDTNAKLRMAVDQARAANMPKENIERAISKAGADAENLEEITYEGFGPFGIQILVDTATDNRNRTSSEIKRILELGGGGLGGPGSVSFNFESKGVITLNNKKLNDDEMLEVIDMGAEDIEPTSTGTEIYTKPSQLTSLKEALEEKGFTVSETDFIKKPKTFEKIESPEKLKKILNLLETLEEHDDVQKVFSNFDADESLIEKVSNE